MVLIARGMPTSVTSASIHCRIGVGESHVVIAEPYHLTAAGVTLAFSRSERSEMMDATASPAVLGEVEARFIELWGTMSSLWGVNPTMARIHGLLFISGATLTMDEIMERWKSPAATSA